MRNWKLYPLLAAVMIVLALLVAPATASAQEPTSTITFDGKTLTGDIQTLTDLMINGVRPAVAALEEPFTVGEVGEFSPYVPDTCFGVTELLTNGQYLLRETVYQTDLSNDRFEAKVPAANSHGDWPPHMVNWNIQSTMPLECGDIVAEISYLMKLTMPTNGAVSYSFSFDQKFLHEYPVMASDDGDLAGLGFFVASATGDVITVNGEEFRSMACHDCLAHTKATTNTVGSGVYTPSLVNWFGKVTEDAPGLIGMHVTPLEKKADTTWTITVQAKAGVVIYLWFGRFDMPQ